MDIFKIKSHIEFFECLVAKFIIEGTEGFVQIDTSNCEFITKPYLVFYPGDEFLNSSSKQFNPTDFFDQITWSYNSIESNLSSDFVYMFMKIFSNESIYTILESKLLSNSPVYIPVYLFFYSELLYVQNQNISWNIKGIKNCEKVELVYDSVKTFANSIDLDKLYPKNKIQIEKFALYNYNIQESIQIPIKDKLQCVFWFYSNAESKYFHPVESIGIECICGSKSRIIVDKRFPQYYNYIQQVQNYSSTYGELYSYSFVSNPMTFNVDQYLSPSIQDIWLKQQMKNTFEPNPNSKQILCIKSLYEINLT